VKVLEKDFSEILGQILGPSMESVGLAVVIDEFQELSRNVAVLDTLRQISEKLTGLMIIGAGLPTFLDNAVFEKFVRTADPIHLKRFDRKESLDLIFEPLGQYGAYTRFEMELWFDAESLYNVVKRSSGNPLHIRMLCGKMIDHYKGQPNLMRLELNRTVMEEVMAYYSSVSEKSRKIRLALESCSREQLEAFGLLYRYEGLSIRAAILLELAFDRISPDREEAQKKALLEVFRDIWDLELFEFQDKSLSLSDIEEMTPSSLSKVEFVFIGDTMDKLYASYFFEELTGRDLVQNENQPLENLFAEKLAQKMRNFLVREELPQDLLWKNTLSRITAETDDQADYLSGFIQDLEKLKTTSQEETSKDSTREALSKISAKHDLYLPAHFASILEYEGYVILIVEARVRGKRRCILDYIPVTYDLGQRSELFRQIESASIDNDLLGQYMINVSRAFVCWLPKQSLLIVREIDLSDEFRTLVGSVGKREFERAVEIAHRIWGLETRLSKAKGRVITEVESYNNFGFSLLNIGKVDDAVRIFEDLSDTLLVSRVNLSYGYYLKGQLDRAKPILNKIIRKQVGRGDQAAFIHVAICHSRLQMSNRIVENVSFHNIAAWNLALINCQESRDCGIINAFLKKVSAVGDELLVHRRVSYWLDYHMGDVTGALDKAVKLRTDCQKLKYLHDDVCVDIEIFQGEQKRGAS
jgi:hypothetical protein